MIEIQLLNRNNEPMAGTDTLLVGFADGMRAIHRQAVSKAAKINNNLISRSSVGDFTRATACGYKILINGHDPLDINFPLGAKQ